MTLNAYALVVLLALILDYLLTIVATVLNLRSTGGSLPSDFADVYDEAEYVRSQESSRRRLRFRIVEETVELVLLLGFWWGGGFAWLDGLVNSWGLEPIPTGLAFIGLLVLGKWLVSLPFRIYHTFVIEEEDGFNRTTPGTFVLDQFKGIILGAVLGGALLAGILWFFLSAGAMAWLYAWLVAIVFILALQLVIPTWIMPLFNKFTPLEEGALRHDILAYSDNVQFPLTNVFVMDGSKRSSRSNAFFTGIGRNRRVALFDTLIEHLSVPELVAVVAHEIGHYKRRHIIQSMIVSLLHLGVILFLLQYFISEPGLFAAFGISQPSVHVGLILFSLLLSPVELLLGILMQMLSRRNEFQADAFAAQTTGKPEAMITALKRLSAKNLQNLTPHPFFAFLFFSHPPVLERVRALQGFKQQASL